MTARSSGCSRIECIGVAAQELSVRVMKPPGGPTTDLDEIVAPRLLC
jgi:hypothetical protein